MITRHQPTQIIRPNHIMLCTMQRLKLTKPPPFAPMWSQSPQGLIIGSQSTISIGNSSSSDVNLTVNPSECKPKLYIKLTAQRHLTYSRSSKMQQQAAQSLQSFPTAPSKYH